MFAFALRKAWSPMALMIVLCLVSTSASAFINGSRVIGFGARSVSQGGVDIAIADDSTGINSNPAGMAWVDGTVVDATVVTLISDITMTNPDNTRDRQNKDRFLVAPGMGFVHHPDGKKWAVGFTMAAPDALATDFTVNARYFNADPLRTGTQSIQSGFSEWMHLRFGPAFSYAVSDTLSLGARLSMDYMTLDIRAPLGRSYVNLGTADGYGYSMGLGLQYRPTDRLSFGLSGETQSFMADLKSRAGDAYMKLDATGLPDGGGGAFPGGTIFHFQDMKAKVSDWESPPVIGAGVSYKVTDKLTLGADFKQYFWSETNDKMVISFGGGDSATMAAVAGTNRLTLPVAWDDSWAMGLGGNYAVSDMMIARLGYNYGGGPTKSNFANYLTPIIFEHHLTAGTSFIFDKLEVCLSIAHSLNVDEKNSANSGVDQSITAQLGGLPIDSELNSMKVDASLTVLGVQFSYRF